MSEKTKKIVKRWRRCIKALQSDYQKQKHGLPPLKSESPPSKTRSEPSTPPEPPGKPDTPRQ